MAQSMTFMVEDAEIMYRNFSGEERTFNQAGKRNFAVVIDEDMAKVLAADGWNVKREKDDEDGNPGRPFIPVEVKYRIKPPKITMITESSRTVLTEDMVGVLDWAEIAVCDLICAAHEWDFNGKTGIKAYLQTMFVTVREDALERKYAVMEEG